MMIMKGCGGDLRVAAGRDLAPDPWGAADLTGKAEHAAPWPSALGMAKVPVALP